jgi:hypothetical protein
VLEEATYQDHDNYDNKFRQVDQDVHMLDSKRISFGN